MQPNSSPPQKPRRTPPKSRFTRRQLAVLVLFGLVCAATLGAMTIFLFSMNPNNPAAAAIEQASTTPVIIEAQATEPSQPTPFAIPADCAKNGSSMQEGEARIVDGQTLEVRSGDRVQLVRFAGLKFLMKSDSAAAASFLAAEVAGQPVTLVKDVTDQDADGRLVRYVFAGGRFINDDLVRQGFARADYNAADRACVIPFQLSEQQARIDRIGIWEATPVPTATFMPLVTLDASQQSCDCSKKYTCDDFQTHAAAQNCFNACNDYSSKLDEDHNGIACENLP